MVVKRIVCSQNKVKLHRFTEFPEDSFQNHSARRNRPKMFYNKINGTPTHLNIIVYKRAEHTHARIHAHVEFWCTTVYNSGC